MVRAYGIQGFVIFFKRIALYIIMEHVMRERIYISTSTVFGSAIPQIVLH